jgi:hypothetical protein
MIERTAVEGKESFVKFQALSIKSTHRSTTLALVLWRHMSLLVNSQKFSTFEELGAAGNVAVPNSAGEMFKSMNAKVLSGVESC